MLPYLRETQSAAKKYSLVFRGLNYGEGTQDGEFADTYNLSTSKYPCITQRAARIRLQQYSDKAMSIHAKGELFVVDGTKVYYGDKLIEGLTVTEGKKQMASIGNYVVIFPDKKYYIVPNDDNPNGEVGDMEIVYKNANLTFTSNTITTDGDDFKFQKGDNIKITGCSESENDKEIVVRSVSGKELTFDDNSFTACENEASVTLAREVPDLDFICESNYRLWGTKGNTIYSSKFSDPLNFANFEALASDSYAIEVSSEGDFTGCIAYSNYICFFKENTLHKLYGTKPANFQVVTASVYGVQSGSERSMHIVNEQLIYKGVGGIYSFTGGVPELISGNFGNNRYSEAVACCDGEIYYVSMKQGDKWHLFTYDVAKGIWLREDETQAVDMAFHDGKVHFIDEKGNLFFIDKESPKRDVTIDTTSGAVRSDIEWGATFCTIHETVGERKGYSKFLLRLDLSAGAWLSVDIKTDIDTQWRQVYTTHNAKAKTFSIPIMPTRCDSIDIRLRGKGECVVKAFIREFTVGSDV